MQGGPENYFWGEGRGARKEEAVHGVGRGGPEPSIGTRPAGGPLKG